MMWDTKNIATFEENGFVMNIKFNGKYDNHIFFCNRHALLPSGGEKAVYERTDIENKILKFKKDINFDKILLVNPKLEKNEEGFVDLIGFVLPPKNGFENLQKVDIKTILTKSNSVVLKGIKTHRARIHEFAACRKINEKPVYDDVIHRNFTKGLSGSLVGLYDDKEERFQPWAVHEAGTDTYGIGISLHDFLTRAEVVESIPDYDFESRPPPKKRQKSNTNEVVDITQRERKYRKKKNEKRRNTGRKRSRSKKGSRH